MHRTAARRAQTALQRNSHEAQLVDRDDCIWRHLLTFAILNCEPDPAFGISWVLSRHGEGKLSERVVPIASNIVASCPSLAQNGNPQRTTRSTRSCQTFEEDPTGVRNWHVGSEVHRNIIAVEGIRCGTSIEARKHQMVAI